MFDLLECVLALCITGMLVIYRAEVTAVLERSGVLNTSSARYEILLGTLVPVVHRLSRLLIGRGRRHRRALARSGASR
jgi:hypothetical protein